MNAFYRRFKSWRLNKKNTFWASYVLLIFTCADASIIPLPAQTFFLLLVISDTSRAARYLLIGIVGTIAGALLGYLIGHYASFDVNGESSGFMKFLFNHVPGFSKDAYLRIKTLFSQYNSWVLFAAAFTPIPYGLLSISSGIFNINVFFFFIIALTSNAVKFILITIIAVKLNPQIIKKMKLRMKPYAVRPN